MPTSDQQKDRWTLAAMSVMLLSAAAVFMLVGDAPHTFLLTAGGLTASFLMPKPLPRTLRSFIYAGLGALLALVLSDQLMRVESRRFFLLRSEIYCPLLLYTAVAATFFDQRDTNVAAVLALALLSLMLGGNVLDAGYTNERLPISVRDVGPFHVIYGIAVVVQLGAMLALLPRALNRHVVPSARRRGAGRAAVLVIAIGMTLGIAAGLRVIAARCERPMQSLFAQWMRRYMLRRANRVVFGQSVDLWRTVPLHTEQDQRIVLRAFSHQAPGYLRGRAYVNYTFGQWLSSTQASGMQLVPPSDDQLSFNIFLRRGTETGDGSGQERRIDILPAPRFETDVLLAPGSAYRFELIATELQTTREGILFPREWEEDAGYTVTLPTAETTSAYPRPQLDDDTGNRYLHVPSAIRDDLTEIADGIFGAPHAPRSTDEAMLRLAGFFGRDFDYELGVQLRGGDTDPVLQFVSTLRRGHCELFASATVLLLRTRGIPARYVTGFVCREPGGGGSHWVARLAHAHAWTEVYVAERGRWELLETTPASGIPQGEETEGWGESIWSRLTAAWTRMLALVKRGYAAQAVTEFVIAVVRALLAFVGHPVGAVITLALALWAAHRTRHWWAARLKARPRAVADPRAELRAAYRAVEKRLARKGWIRTTGVTLRQFAETLATHAGTAETADAVQRLWLEYERLRYGPQPPGNDLVRDFRIRALDLVQNLPRCGHHG